MAINKIITNRSKTHSALKNVIKYVLQDQKVKDGYVAVTGPFEGDEITVDTVYKAFMAEKELWGKDNGRMYLHSTVSFHKDEEITPEKALEVGRRLAEEDPFYKKYQTLVAVHQDKGHLHIHLVSNTVSFVDGYKEQHNKDDIEALMRRTSALCASMGLSVTEKGKHFDGSSIKSGEIISNRTKDYRLLTNDDKQSWKTQMMVVIMDAARSAKSKAKFIALLKQHGIATTWTDTRKYITFEDADGHKCRNSTLAKSFSCPWLETKEALNEYIGTSRVDTDDVGFGEGATQSDGTTDRASARVDATILSAVGEIGDTTAQAVRATVQVSRQGTEEEKKNKRGARL